MSLPILAFLVMMEIVVRSAPNDYSYKWSYLEEHGEAIEYLILGNSQSYYGLDCKVFRPDSFNMGMEGQGLLIDEYILECFIENMPKLKAVVLPMSYLSLTQPAAFGSPGRMTHYHVFYGYDSRWNSRYNYECLVFLSCSSIIKKLIAGESLQRIDSLGFNAHPAGCFKDDADETLLWSTGGSDSIISANKKAVSHIALLCANYDIELYLVSFPTDISYRSSVYNDASQMAMVKTVATALSHDYNHVHWIDFYDSPAFEHSDFFDSSHLNEQGAIKFTKMMNRFLAE